MKNLSLTDIIVTQIGACRHGDRCSRKHIKPPFSQTILLPNVYRNPSHQGIEVSKEDLQADFDRFFEDFYCGLAKYGNLQEMHVCDNVGDHLLGNVYARYEWEAEAQKAVDDLNNRWYAGMSDLGSRLETGADTRNSQVNLCMRNFLP
jgi:splicing factor U2AF subunit